LGVLAMAFEAPAHRQRKNLLYSIHGLNRPVAALTRDPRENMLAMIEVDEVRQVVHLHPRDRASLLDSFHELFQSDCLFFQHAVAIDAKAGGRNPRVAAGPRSIMTVQARNPVLSSMYFVREV
jgi:hypothetical protein